ncbi:MAG: hypothetical protein EBT80_00330 [Chitinophagales bacterium]|nr:hypothetical protein [Chitinophagales bacterium]
MGNTPAQKRQKELRGKNKKRRKRKKREKPDDPRISEISIGGPLKITKSDGTVEIIPAGSEWKKVGSVDYMASPYRKARPRKYR